MITVGNERFTFKVIKRVPNSSYEYEKKVSIVFRGTPANQIEVKLYRIQQGVNGNTDSIFVVSSNLPDTLKPQDKVEFMGKIWTVMSTGYYFDNSRFVNPGSFSDEYIAARCPKGINLQ